MGWGVGGECAVLCLILKHLSAVIINMLSSTVRPSPLELVFNVVAKKKAFDFKFYNRKKIFFLII